MRLYGDKVEVQDKGDVWLIGAESKTYPPASPNDIQAVEALYDATLPDDYREFLLTTNGADLFVHPQPWDAAEDICECSILSTQTILSLYSRLFGAMAELWGPVGLPDKLYYLPVADIDNGDFVAMSTNPDYPDEFFRLYSDSGYIPYTTECDVRAHYRWVYGRSFTEWLNRVLETYGEFGIQNEVGWPP